MVNRRLRRAGRAGHDGVGCPPIGGLPSSRYRVHEHDRPCTRRTWGLKTFSGIWRTLLLVTSMIVPPTSVPLVGLVCARSQRWTRRRMASLYRLIAPRIVVIMSYPLCTRRASRWIRTCVAHSSHEHTGLEVALRRSRWRREIRYWVSRGKWWRQDPMAGCARPRGGLLSWLPSPSEGVFRSDSNGSRDRSDGRLWAADHQTHPLVPTCAV